MKKASHLTLSSIVFFASAFFIIVGTQYSVKLQDVDAQTSGTASTTTRLTDYAWSDNIGWLSFKDGAKPVIVGSDGSLNGYAWSENIGWVQFGGLSGFPGAGGNAKVEGNKITGWARAVAGVAPSNGAVDNRGGWDGWISLGGANYGVTANGNKLSGYAWGSDVVGWVDMSGVRMTVMLNPCSGPYGTVVPDGQNFVFYSAPDSSGQCSSEIRACTNGSLSGSYTEISCQQPQQCTRVGLTYNDGDKGTFYSKTIAGAGQTCAAAKAELTCKDGQFKDADGKVDSIHKYLKCINNPSYIEQ